MARMNESYWSYRVEAAPSYEEAVAAGAVAASSEAEWIKVSPGMRREIVRYAKRRAEMKGELECH